MGAKSRRMRREREGENVSIQLKGNVGLLSIESLSPVRFEDPLKVLFSRKLF